LRAPTEAALRGVVATPAGQTDFAPTLLALLGIDAASLPYVGRNLLGAGALGTSVPVPRPYGDWLDGSHLLLVRGSNRVCHDLRTNMDTSAVVCQPADAIARREREISRLVVTEDLQHRIRTRLEAVVR